MHFFEPFMLNLIAHQESKTSLFREVMRTDRVIKQICSSTPERKITYML